MSSSAINQSVFQAKIGSVQNQADSSSVYSAGVWSFKNSTALTSVTITDAGNVGIGTTPSAWGVIKAIEFAGGASFSADTSSNPFIASNSFFDGANWKYKNTSSAGNYYIAGNTHVWRISPSGTAGNTVTWTQAMTLDASGNLLVGTASSSRRLHVTKSDATSLGVGVFENPNAGNSGVGALVTSIGSGNGTQGNTNCWHLKSVTEGISAYYLYGNGTSSFTSDRRLKKNIEPARDGYAEDLCKLRVVKYHWNANEDSEAKELGLIAQEVEQVFPGLVQEADVEFEGGLKPKVLKGSVLPFMLLKAIQEQQAMIESMKVEIEALKAK